MVCLTLLACELHVDRSALPLCGFRWGWVRSSIGSGPDINIFHGSEITDPSPTDRKSDFRSAILLKVPALLLKDVDWNGFPKQGRHFGTSALVFAEGSTRFASTVIWSMRAVRFQNRKFNINRARPVYADQRAERSRHDAMFVVISAPALGSAGQRRSRNDYKHGVCSLERRRAYKNLIERSH